MALGCIYAVIALSFEIAYESTGVVNFATGQLMAVGALLGTTAVVFAGGAGVPAHMIVALGMALLGIAFYLGVYLPLRGQPPLTIVIGTVGTGVVTILGAVVSLHALYVIAVTAVLIVCVYLLIYRSSLGSQFRALAQDPETARLMGIRVGLLYTLTWILVCVLAGIAGLLIGPMWFVDVGMGDSLGLKAFAAAIIGGFGSISGAICGGILVGLAEILGASYLSSACKDALVFALMFLFLLVRPQGLFGERIADRA